MSKSSVGGSHRAPHIGRLAALREAGEKVEAIREGYEARDALVRMGETLRAAREAQGLTQAALAERVGMTQPGVSRLEAGFGPNGPELETVMRYVHGCNLDLVLELRPKSAVEPKAAAHATDAGGSAEAFTIEL